MIAKAFQIRLFSDDDKNLERFARSLSMFNDTKEGEMKPKLLGGRSKSKNRHGVDVSRALRSSVASRESRPVYRVANKRSAQRADTWSVCEVRIPTGERRQGVVLDESENGLKIRFRTKSTLSGRVQVIVPRLEIHSAYEVVWQSDFDVGCRKL